MSTSLLERIDWHDPSTHVDTRMLCRLSRREQTQLKTAVKAAGRAALPGPAQARVWHYLADAMLAWGKLADRISSRLIQHECAVDKSQLRRILCWLEERELIVRIPGRGRGVLSVYGLHPRLITRFFPAAEPPPAEEEKGVTATPLLAPATPLTKKSPDFPPSPHGEPTPAQSVAIRQEEGSEKDEVDEILASMPGTVAPRREHHRAAMRRLLGEAVHDGYSRQQLAAAILTAPPSRPVWSPVGFLGGRLQRLRTSEQPAAFAAAQRRAAQQSVLEQRQREQQQRDVEAHAARSLWQRIPRTITARLLGGMRATRGRIAQRERIAIRSLRGELEPVLAGVSDQHLAEVLEAWMSQQGWSGVAPVSEDVLANALAAVGIDDGKGAVTIDGFRAAGPVER